MGGGGWEGCKKNLPSEFSERIFCFNSVRQTLIGDFVAAVCHAFAVCSFL